MKLFINIVAILLLSVAFAACQKANDPVSPNTIDKTDLSSGTYAGQNFNGAFEVTYKDYKNEDRPATINGSINFIFGKTTYSYSGVLTNTNENAAANVIHDQGTYTILGNVITLSDDASKMMAHAQWMPSLYLSGDYTYRHNNTQTIIEGNGRFGTIKIVLKNP